MFGVDRLRTSYIPPDNATAANKSLVRWTAYTMGVGVRETIDVDDSAWAQLTAKVAPITIQNPDPVTIGGITLPAGPVALTAAQIGPYLAAQNPGESDLNRLNRHQLVWRAILEKVKASTDPDILPDGGRTGLGQFLQSIAKGPFTVGTLPVQPVDMNGTLFKVDDAAAQAQLAEAVPFPEAPAAGTRPSVRVLNGVRPDPSGAGLTELVVDAGATIASVGNASEFGHDRTVLTYSDPEDKGWAELLRIALGGTGQVKQDEEMPDIADITIVFGKDVVDKLPPAEAGATTTAASGPG